MNITWRKSSHSNTTGGECLEVADNVSAPFVPVRDSKDPSKGTLLFGLDAWVGFVGSLKRG